MSRAFLICPEPVRQVTAGVGSRFLALARICAEAGHTVTLAVPNDPDEADAVPAQVRLIRAEPERLGAQAEGSDWVLVQGYLGNHYLAQRDDLPVVVDLYDPFLIENLHYYRELGLEPFTSDHATWRLQMSRGDFFLCSSEEQRLFYLGWLTAFGRVNPLALEADPELERLIVELPFGTPEHHPPPPPPRSQVLPGIADDAPVLYFGGIYDWFDPLLLLAALPRLLAVRPDTVVVFLEHPHPDLTPLSVAAQARQEATRHGWLGRQVHFVPWRPVGRRFEVPQVCDLAVVTHRRGPETDLSLRTRLVDLLWLGLPMVVTAGGTMARVVGEIGAGVVVPPADSQALAEAVSRLLDDTDGRQRAAAAGRAWAAGRSWQLLAGPLLRFAEAPWRDPLRHRFGALGPGQLVANEPFANRLLRRLRRIRRRMKAGSG